MKLLGRKAPRASCNGKVYHASKKDAMTAFNAIMGSRRGKARHGRPEYLRAYHCDRCGGWHLTHQEERE